MMKYLLFFSIIIFTCGLFIYTDNRVSVSPVTAEYTEGELFIIAADLNKNITAVTGNDSDTKKVRCNLDLLGYQGEILYYAGADDMITRICFLFPTSANWPEVANRISEQLGETSYSAHLENGGAVSEWNNDIYLFSLTDDEKIIKLTMTIYYGQED